ncbi:MAG: ImmA/IrrE family metallo-endopeptidase [Metallibacterium scheffleri]|uniref:ImmA/IrrE family metallo-endopeptidase n=1 Tax=Metallibacterium scheffleri TaxID=993689 RepID=UPI0026EFF21B|nr:ImmA/IrrE family metallo-endopeptidase [Metallibacterium scheffleri]MCK9367556.1 ImmA/IrrE family metallo-endopeptidase [Metallibacterium scheffleri]
MTEFEAEQKARRFVQDAGISAVPVDLGLYVAKVAGKVSLDVLDPEEAGYTMVTGAGPLITINEMDRATRQRFTVCHEIGHLVLNLPSEHGDVPDWGYAKRSPNEVCCDVFAAELLLPVVFFTPLARGMAPDFDAVDELRGKFFASREATASRLAATSRLACAYVLSEGGKVRHMVRSPALRDAHAWVSSGTSLPAGSAAAALRGGSGRSGSATYSGDAWFEGWQDVELSESSVFVTEYDQTLTLLYCSDQDELDALPRAGIPERGGNDEDDALLKPLDGYPGWSGSGRR